MNGTRSARIFAYLLLMPAVFYVMLIVAYPLVDTVILSFTDAALKPTTNWVGWKNYVKMFNGNFTEVITGLHKNPVTLTGTFELRRASEIGTLTVN